MSSQPSQQSVILKEFFRVVRALNGNGIIPVVQGSVGVVLLIGNGRLRLSDIDLLLPDDICNNPQELQAGILALGYERDPDHGQEFIGRICNLSYESFSSVSPCIEIKLSDLHLVSKEGAEFYNLNPEQHIAMYEDGIAHNEWRGAAKRRKDRTKVRLLQQYLKRA